MSRWQHYRYVGTPDPMGEREAYQCDRYLRRNRQRMLTAGRYLIDSDALLTLFHLDCSNCPRVHREMCCNGQPYAVDARQVPVLEQVAPDILERYMPDTEQLRFNREGIWEQGKPSGTIRLNGNRCLFYAEVNGGRGCAIHTHAEAGGQPVYPLKPFSCQLYPLDLIENWSHVLITALTAETSRFSRWGAEYLEQFLCASLERRQQMKHLDPGLFAVEGYRPAYQWSWPFLRYMLGEEAEAIERELEAAWKSRSR